MHRDAVLMTQSVGAISQILIGVLIDHYLGEAVAVAQIDEEDAAVVSTTMNPSVQNDRATGVGAG
jgi:hypothetical protein